MYRRTEMSGGMTRRAVVAAGLRAGAGLAGLTAAGALLGCGDSGDSAAGGRPDGPIKLGTLQPITGALSSSWMPTFLALDVAVEEINGAGGVLGQRIELVRTDDEGAPGREPAAVRKLSGEGVRFIAGPTGSSQTLSALAATTPARIISCGYAGDDEVGDASRYPYHYSCIFNTTQSARTAVRFALDDLRTRRIGILSENTAYGSASTKASTELLAEAGVKPVSVQTYPIDAQDLRPYLRNLREAGAEVLLGWVGSGAALVQLVSGLKSLSWYVPLVGHTSLLLTPIVAGMPEQMLDQTYGMYYRPLTWTRSEPIAAPQERFASSIQGFRETPTLGVAMAAAPYYDFAHLLTEAIGRAGTLDVGAVKEEMDAIRDHPTLLGSVTFTAEEHSGLADEDVVLATARSADDRRARGVFRERASS